jgi:hypothetical protein
VSLNAADGRVWAAAPKVFDRPQKLGAARVILGVSLVSLTPASVAKKFADAG